MKSVLSRRRLAFGLATLPIIASSPAAASDERADYRKRLFDAYAEDRAMRPVYGTCDGSSVEEEACCLVMARVWSIAYEIGKLPPAKTPAGLGLTAMAAALMWEGEDPSDSMDAAVIGLIRSTLIVTSTAMPPGWTGFGDEPGMLQRDRALHTGSGVIPAWAMAEAAAARCA